MKLQAATVGDVAVILGLIRELASYEREPHAVNMSDAQLHDALFGEPRRAEALVVEIGGSIEGFAIWFESFNTWTGRPALSVEDVFVRKAHRGRGVGRAIFRYLAKLAKEPDYFRMDWQVLDWNAPSIRFYEGLGATAQRAWLKYRLSGSALDALAATGD